MKYFNYLDIAFEPAAIKLKDYLLRKNLVEDIKSAWRKLNLEEVLAEVPELQELFKPLGLDIDTVAIFVTYYELGAIHIDDDFRTCRINFPVMNCNNTFTKYFKVKGVPHLESQVNGYKLHMFKASDCEFIDQFSLTKAVVMRVLEPHQVVSNHKNFPRVSCTVAFKQNIEHLLEE